MQLKTSFLQPEDSNCMGASQSSTKERNCILFPFSAYNKSWLSERDFVDDGGSPKNELCRSGRVKTMRNI